MNTKQLSKIGVPFGKPMEEAINVIKYYAMFKKNKKKALRDILEGVIEDPKQYLEDTMLFQLSKALIEHKKLWSNKAFYRQWGKDIDPNAIQQMENACRLPISVQGALMPDAHLGYGLPIGGVLATYNSVIPYAVGVDIACRMKLSVYNLPVEVLDMNEHILISAIEKETRFGIGCSFKDKRDHDVMDEDWSITEITKKMKDKAWSQLGTSGSGNHFVEFGIFTIKKKNVFNDNTTEEPYLALLTHSGSRGAGANVANHYSKLAMELRKGIPEDRKHLAWLDLDTEEGQEYWNAMELMGRYASANHKCIHDAIAKNLEAEVLIDIENHHNFAWKETHHGKEVIVHRKGATPAGKGVLGVIPGTMASETYIVEGKGLSDSLNSASHGAGRVMSRKQAKKTFNWEEVNKQLKERKVKLLSAGIDESPGVYKDINKVMREQCDLVDIVATFEPRLVKMAPQGERPED